MSIAQGIVSEEPDLPARIERAIRLVQDECRYFSVNLELGGQIPSTPETVIQRRFGDCKDLSWLLVNLLKKLGIQARPVLVNTFLKKTIGELLPTPSLFNHVVVEFEAEGKKRWVDTTLKEQGGGPFNRIIAKYDLGLPIDAAATGLVSPPQVPEQSNLFELRESILLDTSGAPSLLAVIQQNEGNQAEILRQQITKTGLEEVTRQRLQSITSRFRNASRIGSMQYRDDRTANRFVLTEVFEIHPFLSDHPNNKLCRFQLPTNWITGVLPMPEKTVRKSPFALPHPCRITYIIDVESPSIRSMTIHDPLSQLSSPFVAFSRKDKAGQGYFLMNLALETKADSIPAEQVEQHRQLVEQVWQATCRELSVFKGYSRSRQKRDFGELPPLPSKTQPPPLSPRLLAKSIPRPEPNQRSSAPDRQRHKRHHAQNFPSWLKIALAVFIAFWLLMIILIKIKPHP